MSGTHTVVGTYGDMPFDMFIRRSTVTCTPDDPTGMDAFFRRELKHTGPVAPTLESDQPRSPGRDNDGGVRGGYESRGRINLRVGGSRALSEAWLPDGTFLDHPFTEPDPRSIMYEPDMRKSVDQQRARGRFIKQFSDEDFSIPESGIAPGEMVRNIKHAQYRVADSMKIFSTSMSNFQNGGIGVLPNQDRYVARDDERPLGIGDFTLQNRRNLTTEMSDLVPIGWNTTTDHEFKVSSYGRLAIPALYAQDGHYQNRAASRLDHEVFTQVEEKIIPHDTARLIADLTRLKRDRHATGYNPIFNEAVEHTMKTRQQLIDASLTGIFGKSQESRAESAHSLLPSERMGDGRQFVPRADNKRKEKGITMPLSDAKDAGVAMFTKRRVRFGDDLRDAAEQSGPTAAESVAQKPLAFVDMTGDIVLAKHISDYSFPKGEEKTVSSYKAGPLRTAGIMSQFDFEDYGSQSDENTQRRAVSAAEFDRYYGGEIDNSFGRDDEQGYRGGTILGGKQTRSLHSRDHAEAAAIDGVASRAPRVGPRTARVL